MSTRRRRRRVEPTDEWELLLPLFEWPEQESYEAIRPLVLFGESVAERASEVGTSTSTLYRRMERFEADGMESLFGTEKTRRRKLPPTIRRLIVNIKGEYPSMRLGEIANICYVRFGRRPSKHTIKRVLSEDPIPLKIMRRFDPYHEIPEPRERRTAVVSLHSEGGVRRPSRGISARTSPLSTGSYAGGSKKVRRGSKTSPTGDRQACARWTSQRSRRSGVYSRTPNWESSACTPLWRRWAST